MGEQTDSLLTVEPPVGPPDLPAASPTHTVQTHYTFDTDINMTQHRYTDTKPLATYLCIYTLIAT